MRGLFEPGPQICGLASEGILDQMLAASRRFSLYRIRRAGAIVSASPSAFGANHHLRQCLASLNVPTMAQPEAYIGGAANLFDAQGKMTNESTREFLATFVKAFAAWIEANRKPSARAAR